MYGGNALLFACKDILQAKRVGGRVWENTRHGESNG